MKTTAVIVAGGSGQRMGTAIPKQFLPLYGKPVLWHTVKSFLDALDDMQVIVVLPEPYMQEGAAICSGFPDPHRIRITAGGDTRFDSVKAGLQLVQAPSVILVHDAVRCLVTPGLIQRCCRQAIEKGSAVPAVAATDSIRILENGSYVPANREQVRIIQTPQTFVSEWLLPAFEQPYHPSFTDEATVVEAAGKKIHLIEGEHENIKITRPVDLLIAESVLGNRGVSLS
jgi:2-C-methyl-D-erythritol 4-phosphate cytidylyltransferase